MCAVQRDATRPPGRPGRGSLRIGYVCREGTANAHYRVLVPLRELQRRGHRVVFKAPGPDFDPAASPKIDLLHMHQWVAEDLSPIRRLQEHGIAVVWDTDDDVLHAPRSKELRQVIGGRRQVRRFHELSLEVARTVDLVTTTNETLAEVFRDAGAEHVAVIGNYLERIEPRLPRRKHVGVLVGIVAGVEHAPDVKALKIPQALRDLQRKHEHLHVAAIGVDLGLKERYVHTPKVPFDQLLPRIREFDIGLAPLADSPFSRSRSDVKLKEYASMGVPWLASPVGPYATIDAGTAGGVLVDDGEWLDVLDALIADPRERQRFADAGRAWADQQQITHVRREWEAALNGALRHPQAQPSARIPAQRA